MKNKKVQIILSLCILVVLVLINRLYIYGSENTQLYTVGYLKESDDFLLPVNDVDEVDEIESSYEKVENPKITIEKSNTLLDYEIDTDPVEYAKDNQESMVEGTEMTLGENTLYLKNKKVAKDAKNIAIKLLLQDSYAYNNYLQTGEMGDINYQDKIITRIDIEDEVSFSKTYVPKDKIIISPEDLLFTLAHKDYKTPEFIKEKYTITSDDTLNSILEKNDITYIDFYLNNPEYQGTPLFNEGDEIVINKIDPIIKVAAYYEETVEEVEEYDTIEKENKDLAVGEKDVVQKGEDGLSTVTYKKKAVNGVVESQETITRESIKDPESKIVEVGPEEDEPSSESNPGKLIWPSDTHSMSRGLQYGHNGLDIVAPYGAPIYAAADGVVEFSGWNTGGGGNEVRIDHGGGLFTIYSHQSTMPLVSAGQSVKQGQVIGYTGATGMVSGTHLHYEVRVGCTSGAFSGYPVEPYAYM